MSAEFADLHACCSCLGFREGSLYKADVDAEASLRQIMRYLRNEGSNFGIRKELGRMKIVVSDLIPLLLSCNDSSIVFELVVRLMLNLTQPAIVCFRQEIPKDRDMCAIYLELDEILKQYKRAFAERTIFQKLSNKISTVLEREPENRSEEDKMMIERIIILVRNILHISDLSEDQKINEDVSIHDQIVIAMHLTGWEELLLYFSNGQEESTMYAFHTLEVISLLLKEQTPELLAFAGKENLKIDSDSKILERHLLREKERQRSSLFDLSARTNRFGATYELKNLICGTNKSIVYHHDITKPLIESKTIMNKVKNHNESIPSDAHEFHPSGIDHSFLGIVNLSIGKKIVPRNKNQKPLIEFDKHRKSTLNIRLILQKFCLDFLKFCYNSLMNFVRGALQRHAAQSNDETYYLWACKFFMGFARLYDFKSDVVSETLNMSTYQFMYDQIVNYRDAIIADKRGGPNNQGTMQNSRRLSLSVSALREFLTCVQTMMNYKKLKNLPSEIDSEIQRLVLQKEYAESLMANIFYMEEYLNLFPMLLKDYNQAIQSKTYLSDLVEATQLFIWMMKHSQGNGTMIVLKSQRRNKKAAKRRRMAAQMRREAKERAKKASESKKSRQQRLGELWTETDSGLMHQLADRIKANNELDLKEKYSNDTEMFDTVAPLFDASSNLDESKQLHLAFGRIQKALHNKNPSLAHYLAMKMWKIWPETNPQELEIKDDDENVKFGREQGLGDSDIVQCLALFKIHMADLIELEENSSEMIEDKRDEQEEEEEESENDNLIARELAGDSDVETIEKEASVDLKTFYIKMSNPKIILAYTLLLGEYATNSSSTNDAIVRLFYAIAVKSKMPGVFFQLRTFRIFQHFIHDKGLSSSSEFADLLKFIKYIMRIFFKSIEANKKICLEPLFLRNIKESVEVTEGYGTFEGKSSKSTTWTPESERQLAQLFKDFKLEPVDLGRDLVDIIMDRLADKIKTRRQVVAKMINLGLISSAKEIKYITVRMGRDGNPTTMPRRSGAKRTPWNESEIDELRDLVAEYRESDRILQNVMLALQEKAYEKNRQIELLRQQRLKQVLQEGIEYPEMLLDQEIPLKQTRPKAQVIKKIMELKLVNDRSELGPVSMSRKKLSKIETNGSEDIRQIKEKEEKKAPKSQAFIYSEDENSLEESDNSDVGHDYAAEEWNKILNEEKAKAQFLRKTYLSSSDDNETLSVRINRGTSPKTAERNEGLELDSDVSEKNITSPQKNYGLQDISSDSDEEYTVQQKSNKKSDSEEKNEPSSNGMLTLQTESMQDQVFVIRRSRKRNLEINDSE